MQSVIKGMVQVAGSTYRVVRVQPGQHSVVRILDDQHVSASTRGPAGTTLANGIEPGLLREIRRMAVEGAKTSWVGHLSPG